MLRIYAATSQEHAKKYYSEAPSLEAYYSEGQEFAGFWYGESANRLGLSGRVDKASFELLCENRHPATQEKLTPRNKVNRRPGYDFNFNCPKSVSLAYFYTKDERIMRAFRQAVLDTMLELERAAATRVRMEGRDEDRTTGNIAWAENIHLTARPIGGVADPHLHAHCFVFNATWDSVENRWKALQVGEIHEEADYYNGVFMMRLAANLQELGLSIEPGKRSFEIAGISKTLNRKFSRRTVRIEEEAERLGVVDPSSKANLAAQTRERKAKSLLIPDLEPLWWGRLLPEEKQALEAVKGVLRKPPALEKETSKVRNREESSRSERSNKRTSINRATRPYPSVEVDLEVTEYDRRAVALAVEHLFERQSVVTEKKLIGEAYQSWCIGRASRSGIIKAVAELPLLRKVHRGKVYVTTKEVVEEENRIIEACVNGRWRLRPINPGWHIRDGKLNEQQRAAVRHIVGSQDAIIGISGKAGVGKTTLLHEARRAIEAAGHKLLILSPTADASRGVLRRQGFETAETVAKLLCNKPLQAESKGAVICVDEAGLLSTREADELLQVVANIGARLVLVGDIGQHSSVERGQAMRLLEKFGGMSVVKVEEIQRQKGPYKKFVECVANHDWEKAFAVLGEIEGAIQEMPLGERRSQIAEDYVRAWEQKKSVAVLAPTNKECLDVTEGIRQLLKEKRILGDGVKKGVLRDLGWTAAQKRDPDHYEKGLVVQVNLHVKGFALGEQLEVVSVTDDRVLARSKHRTKTLPLAHPEAFSVYEREELEICPGEILRLTSNGRAEESQHLFNGKEYHVEKIKRDGTIVLSNGRKLKKDWKHIEHGYVTTSYSAQGKTTDIVLVAQSFLLSASASDALQFYVSISRGKDGLVIYTENIELLKELISRAREQIMATELLAKPKELDAVMSYEPEQKRETIEDEFSYLREKTHQENLRRRIEAERVLTR